MLFFLEKTEFVFLFWHQFYSVIIGSGNGMAPSRHQAINWTNDDSMYWWIYPYKASLVLNVSAH